MEPIQTYISCPVWLSHTNIFTQIEDSLERGMEGWGWGTLSLSLIHTQTHTHSSQDSLSSPTAFSLITIQRNKRNKKQLQGYDILTQEEP